MNCGWLGLPLYDGGGAAAEEDENALQLGKAGQLRSCPIDRLKTVLARFVTKEPFVVTIMYLSELSGQHKSHSKM